MKEYFGERAHLDEASTILDSNSQEALGETKEYPAKWELTWKTRSKSSFLTHPFPSPTFPLCVPSVRSRYIQEHTENAWLQNKWRSAR